MEKVLEKPSVTYPYKEIYMFLKQGDPVLIWVKI